MGPVVPSWGTRVFSAKVLRLLTGAAPRQLVAITADHVRFGPGGGWVELAAPAVPAVGRHPAIPGRRFRFERGLTALDCPVRATRVLLDASGSGSGVLFDAGLRDEAVRLLTDRGMEAAWHSYWRPLFVRNGPANTIADAHQMAAEQNVNDVIRGVRAAGRFVAMAGCSRSGQRD